jgi:hypothetical protein
MILNLLRVLANRCSGSFHALGVTSLEVVGVDVKESQAATSAGRIPDSAILVGGTLGGVLVFAMALALSLSSRFPTPRDSGWVIEPDSNPASIPDRNEVDSPRFTAVASMETIPAVAQTSPVEMTSSAVAKMSVEAISVMTKIPAAQTATLGDLVLPVAKVSFADRWTSVMALPEAVSSVQMPAQAARLETPGRRAAPPQARSREISVMKEVDEYLWEVYRRTAVKSDFSGDFTWKDLAAAKRAGMSVRDYVIGGMDADFREQLYHAGRAMDSNGINWSMLSAFRDDLPPKPRFGLQGPRRQLSARRQQGDRRLRPRPSPRYHDRRRRCQPGTGSTPMARSMGSAARFQARTPPTFSREASGTRSQLHCEMPASSIRRRRPARRSLLRSHW